MSTWLNYVKGPVLTQFKKYAMSSPGRFSLALEVGGQVSQWYGHPRVLGIPIPISLTFWRKRGDAQNTVTAGKAREKRPRDEVEKYEN